MSSKEAFLWRNQIGFVTFYQHLDLFPTTKKYFYFWNYIYMQNANIKHYDFYRNKMVLNF